MPPRKPRSAAGIKEIAAAANVSMMTVSRALRGVDGVSEKTRKRIEKLAQKLNYVPNSNARSLAMTNADLIGISMPTLFNDVFADVLAGMRRTIEAAGFSSVIDTTEYSVDAEFRWAERLLSWRPAGVVFVGCDHHPGLRDLLRKTDVPVLEVWEYREDPIDLCVGIDHVAAGKLAAEHTQSLGYRSPAFVGAKRDRDPRAEARLTGLRRVYRDLPDDLPVARSDRFNDFRAGKEATETLLGAHRPDVIFYLNDHFAFGGISACAAHGLRVPEDIGIVGFNALDLTSVLPVELTTIATPRRQMGVVGARSLLARIHGVDVEPTGPLPVRLVAGATTRLQS